MDLTKSFKKLYEAIPSIKCNSDRARYADTGIDDAGYFGSCGTGSYLVLPDTLAKRRDRWDEIQPYNKFFASIPDREVELIMTPTNSPRFNYRKHLDSPAELRLLRADRNHHYVLQFRVFR